MGPEIVDGVLAIVWSFLHESLVWQTQGNDESWITLDRSLQAGLALAMRKREDVVVLRGGNWNYRYDLLRLTQTNLSTGRCRRVACWNPYCNAFLAAGAAAAAAIEAEK